MLEAVAVAIHGVSLAKNFCGEYALVVGAGTIGVLTFASAAGGGM